MVVKVGQEYLWGIPNSPAGSYLRFLFAYLFDVPHAMSLIVFCKEEKSWHGEIQLFNFGYNLYDR